MSNKSKVSVCFVVPVESSGNAKEVQAAYGELRRQINQFSNAITRDPNTLVHHAVVSPDPKDLKPVMAQPADSKLAETYSVNKPEAIKEAASKTKKADKKEAAPVETDEDFEKPRVVSVPWTPPTPIVAPSAAPVANSPTKVEATTKVVMAPKPIVNTGHADVLNNIFKDLKRTKKSEAILTYLASKDGLEVTVNDIVEGSGIDNAGVNSWMAMTSEHIKGATVSKVKRGVYKFETVKL